MKVFHNSTEAAGKIANSVVTTGSFDGVHIGHKIIIERLNQIAREISGESTLLTFYPHPRKVLYPEQTDLKLINSQEEKIELLSKTGLQNLIIIPFSLEFSKTTSHDFLKEILLNQLRAKVIVVGNNHHFGYNRAGDYGYLHELSHQLGFRVEDIPLKYIENETVSSTKIRKALLEGNIMRANAYLDHQYIIAGEIHQIPGFTSGNYYRIILPEKEKLVPPPGIYATCINSHGRFHKSMTIIQKTEGDGENIDSLIFDDDVVLVGKKATFFFYKRIKGGEVFFENNLLMDELLEAKEEVEELIY
jgi:riboflavin kinase / FMN adenylyltransferase